MLEQDNQVEVPVNATITSDECDNASELSSAVNDGSLNGRNIDAILSVKLDVRVVLGRNRMPVSELLNLTKGSVIELDRKVGEPVDVMVNDRVVARGDLVKVQDEMIGVALREIVKDFSPDL